MKIRKLKKKNAVIAAILLTVMIAVIFTGCGEANTTIVNPDFEEGGGNEFAGWEISDYEKDFNEDETASTIAAVPGLNGNCVSITNNIPDDTRLHQKISVKQKTNYKISVDIKTEDVGEDGAGAVISSIDGTETSIGIRGTTDWQTVTVYTKTAKKQTTIDLSIGLGGYGAESVGTAMFDNLRIEKVSSVPSEAYSIKMYKDTSSSSSSASSSPSAGKGLKLLFICLLAGLIILTVVLGIKSDNDDRKKGLKKEDTRKIDKIDLLIIIILTAVCSAVSFFRLGDTDTANNFFESNTPGEYAIVEFDDVTNVCGMSHLSNIPGNGSFEIYYEATDGEGDYKLAFTIGKMRDGVSESQTEKKPGSFFEWKITTNMNMNTRRLKIISKKTGWAVNEIGFLTKDENHKYKVIPLKVVDQAYVKGLAEGSPSNLFDEQECVQTEVNYMNSTYFDEIYHARTAYEMINGDTIYEWTHPPLGKTIIGLGIRMFGMTPFGWRFMGTLFGVLMVPLIYLFACKIFKKRNYAILTGGLFTVEFMRLAHSRIATIDSFSTFFILLMYFFMYDYFVKRIHNPRDWKAWLSLGLCGISFGLGAATKWTCLYAGAGLALLFFATQIYELVDTRKKNGSLGMKTSEWFVKRFLPVCGFCVIFFVVIPGTIYLLSYLPYKPSHPYESLWHIMIENQKSMFSYHSGLSDDHPYMSSWWSWPLDMRPIWMYCGDSAIGNRSTIASFGNPAIWMLTIPAIIGTLYYMTKKKDKKMIVVLVAFALEFMPWILVTRCAFIYHFMPCTPFVVLMIVYCFENLIDDKVLPKWSAIVYLGVAAVLFGIFYPVLTGLEVKESYVEGLRWFGTWYF